MHALKVKSMPGLLPFNGSNFINNPSVLYNPEDITLSMWGLTHPKHHHVFIFICYYTIWF